MTGVTERVMDALAPLLQELEQRMQTEATLRVQLAEDSQNHLDRALRAEAALARLLDYCGMSVLDEEAYNSFGDRIGRKKSAAFTRELALAKSALPPVRDTAVDTDFQRIAQAAMAEIRSIAGQSGAGYRVIRSKGQVIVERA